MKLKRYAIANSGRPQNVRHNYMKGYKQTILLIVLGLTACINNPQTEGNILPPRLIDFGVVTVDSLKAIQTKSILHDKEVYQLLSDAILPHGHLKDSEKLKLVNLTTSDIQRNIEFPLTDYCSRQDSVEFFESIDTMTYSFDCALLPNTICISAAEVVEIFAPPYRDWETDRKSTRLNSSHITRSRMPSSA